MMTVYHRLEGKVFPESDGRAGGGGGKAHVL